MESTVINYKLVANELKNLTMAVRTLPTKTDVELAIIEGLKTHVKDCPLYQGALRRGVDEITQTHDVSAYRRDLARAENAKSHRGGRSHSSIPEAFVRGLKRPFIGWLLFGLGAVGAGVMWALEKLS